MEKMLFKQEKKISIAPDIQQIKAFDDLKRLGGIIEDAKKIDIKSADELFMPKYIQELQLPGVLAIILCLPVNLVPNRLFELITALFKDPKMAKTISSLSTQVLSGIVLRYVRCAVLCAKGNELFDSNFLQKCQKEKPQIYTAPLLYLAAQINKPIIFPDIKYEKDARIDTLTIYYMAVNYLMLRRFAEAEALLCKAYKLSKNCKDIRPSIIHKMSLASFLNHTPRAVFENRIAQKNWPVGQAEKIWGIDEGKYDSDHVDVFYKDFGKEIRKEHTRRVIFDVAETITRIPMKELQQICGGKNVDNDLEGLKKSGEIVFEVENDIVEFKAICFQVPVENEMKNVSRLLNIMNDVKTSK